MKPFQFVGEAGTCKWCGDRLRHRYRTEWEGTGCYRPLTTCFWCDASRENLAPSKDAAVFTCRACRCDVYGEEIRRLGLTPSPPSSASR